MMNVGLKRKRTDDMRQRHNIISQKGRQKINDQIMLLKRILPECRDVECNKASILNCAVRTLEKFNLYQAQVVQANMLLERENRKLLKIIEKLEAELNHCRTLHPKAHAMKLLPIIDHTALFSNSFLESSLKKPRLDNLNLIPCDGTPPNELAYAKVEITTDLPQFVNLANINNNAMTSLPPCSPVASSTNSINTEPPTTSMLYESLYSSDGIVFKTTCDVPFSSNTNWPFGVPQSATTTMTSTTPANSLFIDPINAMSVSLT
jgi:hypothetical protein